MGDRMKTIPFASLLDRVVNEYERERSIYGIRETDFFRDSTGKLIDYNGECMSNLIGPAAGHILKWLRTWLRLTFREAVFLN